MREQLKAFYLEWVNDFLTVACFAAHHKLTVVEAVKLINMGKSFHEEDC